MRRPVRLGRLNHLLALIDPHDLHPAISPHPPAMRHFPDLLPPSPPPNRLATCGITISGFRMCAVAPPGAAEPASRWCSGCAGRRPCVRARQGPHMEVKSNLPWWVYGSSMSSAWHERFWGRLLRMVGTGGINTRRRKGEGGNLLIWPVPRPPLRLTRASTTDFLFWLVAGAEVARCSGSFPPLMLGALFRPGELRL